MSEEMAILTQMHELLEEMRKNKPQERGELARKYAVAITEMEKTAGYWDAYVVRNEGA